MVEHLAASGLFASVAVESEASEADLVLSGSLEHFEAFRDREAGKQALINPRPGSRALNSPWDLCYVNGRLFIAMAGAHQIWQLKGGTRRATAYAGNGIEDIIDGPLLPRSLGQKGK